MKTNIQRRINKGMWVLAKVQSGTKRIGILAEINLHTSTGEVHLIMDDGTTGMVLPNIRLAALEQAKLKDIPECRRPNDIVAKRLGY